MKKWEQLHFHFHFPLSVFLEQQYAKGLVTKIDFCIRLRLGMVAKIVTHIYMSDKMGRLQNHFHCTAT